MELSERQKRFFYKEGYLKVAGAVPRVMVDAARQVINAEMGKGNTNPFSEINTAPVIADLFNETPVFSLLESALGKGNLQRCQAGGIKLNFPRAPGSSADALTKKLDGAEAVGISMGSRPWATACAGCAKTGRITAILRRLPRCIWTTCPCPMAAILPCGPSRITFLRIISENTGTKFWTTTCPMSHCPKIRYL